MSEDAPRLYLITPRLRDATPFVAAFSAALAAADVACVHIRTASGIDTQTVSKPFVSMAQKHGAACLLDDPQLALQLNADGVHVDAGGALDAALKALKPNSIVGTGGLVTRDDAMHAGESGVDYLMFGGPDETLAAPQIHEQIAWWAEIFNVPCVAYAPTLADIPALANAGADFVALESAVWDDPRGPAAAIAGAAQMLAGRAAG